MRTIKKMDDYLAFFEKSLAVILYATLIFSITFNIFTRNIFNFTFQEILELTPAFVLWLALVGATLALRKQRHIKIELLLRFCTERIRFLAHIASCTFGIAVMGILFWVSLAFIKPLIYKCYTESCSVVALPHRRRSYTHVSDYIPFALLYQDLNFFNCRKDLTVR